MEEIKSIESVIADAAAAAPASVQQASDDVEVVKATVINIMPFGDEEQEKLRIVLDKEMDDINKDGNDIVVRSIIVRMSYIVKAMQSDKDFAWFAEYIGEGLKYSDVLMFLRGAKMSISRSFVPAGTIYEENGNQCATKKDKFVSNVLEVEIPKQYKDMVSQLQMQTTLKRFGL